MGISELREASRLPTGRSFVSSFDPRRWIGLGIGFQLRNDRQKFSSVGASDDFWAFRSLQIANGAQFYLLSQSLALDWAEYGAPGEKWPVKISEQRRDW